MSRVWRVAESAVVGMALAVLVVGLALFPLTQPAFTRIVAGRYALAQEAGLTRSQMLSTAEQVRRFVVGGDAGSTLPATVAGRAGFDAAAVSHLVDVRRVIRGAQIVTGVLAALVAAWVAVGIARKRTHRIASAMRVAAVALVVFVLIAVLVGFADFEWLFTQFHGLFFAAGTWEFPADSLLILVFPETFWATAGATWAALMLLGAAALGVGARFVRERPTGGPSGDVRHGAHKDA